MFVVKESRSSNRINYGSEVEKANMTIYRQKPIIVSVKTAKDEKNAPTDSSPSRETSQDFDEDDDVYDEQEEVETGKVTI